MAGSLDGRVMEHARTEKSRVRTLRYLNCSTPLVTPSQKPSFSLMTFSFIFSLSTFEVRRLSDANRSKVKIYGSIVSCSCIYPSKLIQTTSHEFWPWFTQTVVIMHQTRTRTYFHNIETLNSVKRLQPYASYRHLLIYNHYPCK